MDANAWEGQEASFSLNPFARLLTDACVNSHFIHSFYFIHSRS